MTPCARSCCWVPMAGVCARNRSCPCHWEDQRPVSVKGGADAAYSDPTASQAIRNVMNEGRRK